MNGSCLISGSSLISGELSGSRLTRFFELGESERADLHAAQRCFSLSCGQGLHAAQLNFSLPRGQGLHSTQLRFTLP